MYSMVPSCFLHIRTSVVNQIITVPQLLPRGLNLTKSSTNNVTKLNPQHKQHHVIVGHHMWSNVTWTEGRPVSQIGSKKRTLSFLPEIPWSTEPALYCKPDSVFWNPRLPVEKVIVQWLCLESEKKHPERTLKQTKQKDCKVQWWQVFWGVLHEVLSLKSFQKRSKKYHCWISYHDLFCTWLL